MEAIIVVDSVSMRFNLANERSDSIKEYLIKLMKGNLNFKEFYALRNVSFLVGRGESLGILGANGAGKSTLLKCIAGIYPPSEGKIAVRGVVAPLIELGAGFDPDLTARENVFLNGALMGYSKKFVYEKYDEIVEFSELGDFMDVSIKNFSSGMIARLGFAIATIVKPDILIADEVLGVGDAAFRKKCEQKMHELREGGTTLLLVSHMIEQVKNTCTKAVWLIKGELAGWGDVDEVCGKYDEWSRMHTAFE
jgi:ABC-2 type transport system ATP-binding protein/lipopolysaccharide transport system ATP-binding protein